MNVPAEFQVTWTQEKLRTYCSPSPRNVKKTCNLNRYSKITFSNRFSLLSNKDDDLSQVSNICRPNKNNGKKTHTRYCQYTPTWFKSGQESTIGCSRRNVCKPRTEILDLNSKEILDLEKIEACANMNKTARKEIDSLKRKLKEYSTDCEELRSGEADTIMTQQ